jgi:hypothetical protein
MAKFKSFETPAHSIQPMSIITSIRSIFTPPFRPGNIASVKDALILLINSNRFLVIAALPTLSLSLTWNFPLA